MVENIGAIMFFFWLKEPKTHRVKSLPGFKELVSSRERMRAHAFKFWVRDLPIVLLSETLVPKAWEDKEAQFYFLITHLIIQPVPLLSSLKQGRSGFPGKTEPVAFPSLGRKHVIQTTLSILKLCIRVKFLFVFNSSSEENVLWFSPVSLHLLPALPTWVDIGALTSELLMTLCCPQAFNIYHCLETACLLVHCSTGLPGLLHLGLRYFHIFVHSSQHRAFHKGNKWMNGCTNKLKSDWINIWMTTEENKRLNQLKS